MILYVDTETFNEAPITVGTARYCETVEIMVIAWAVDDGPVHVWDVTDNRAPNAWSQMNERFVWDWQDPENELVVAHNAFFDRSVLATKGVERPLNQWHCTQAQALAHSLPGSLDKLSAIYNLGDAAKDKEGKQLIQLFCKPRPKTSKIRRATRETHPAEWQKFLDYAGQDIVALRALHKKLPKWNWTEAEREAWMLNQEINDRGFLIDQELAVQAIATCERAKAALQSRTEVITGTDLSVQQRAALQALLKEYGVALPDMTASTLERRLEDPDLPAPVRDLIGIRLEMCQTSNAKWPKLLASVSSDGRLRGTSQFCGASRTGRDSGRIFQPYNLPRPPKYLDGDEDFVEAIKLALVDLIYDNPMEVTSAALRGALVAPPGKKLVVADLNAIEGRVAAWVAGEQWKRDAYARGDDLYVLAYAASFHKRPEDVTKAERQIGKVEELALGFGGAAGAFGTMAAMYGVELPDDEVRAVVKAWRAANPKIVAAWWRLEDCVKQLATCSGTAGMDLPQLQLPVRKQGSWLRIILPSGRSLSYAQPKIEDGQFTYTGLNHYTHKWERIRSYGGKLFENVVQAIARDVLVEGMKRVQQHELFDIVLTVYDEIITEAPHYPCRSDVDALISLMTTIPHWAPGLPLAAGGFETYRYYKG